MKLARGFELKIAQVNRSNEAIRLERLDIFIRGCLQLPSLADEELIRAALLQRQDNLLNWYENRRRAIGKGND